MPCGEKMVTYCSAHKSHTLYDWGRNIIEMVGFSVKHMSNHEFQKFVRQHIEGSHDCDQQVMTNQTFLGFLMLLLRNERECGIRRREKGSENSGFRV